MKKQALLLLVLTITIINVSLIIAINLEVKSEAISNIFIIELEDPATYKLTIKNLEETDTFDIYSLIGINISPNNIFIATNQTKSINIELIPQQSLKSGPSPFTFEYKISNSKDEIQKESLTINIINLESAFYITPQPVSPNSEKVMIEIKNNVITDFPEITFKTSSAFFNHTETISLGPNEIKEIEVQINEEILIKLDAGNYIMKSEIIIENNIAEIQSQIKFIEQEGLETSKEVEGSIIQRTEIIRKNIGNVKKTISITEEKNIIAHLFTTINIPPTKIETNNYIKIYTWEKTLLPNEEYKIIIRTNWIFPFIILVILLTAFAMIRKSIYANLELTKRVTFVKTKGGQFALKVTLRMKAKNHLENITVIDTLPQLVKLYNKFGIIAPNRYDQDKRKLYWNLQSLNKDETRIFTYIIYSKIGVIGRFELPEAKAIYDHNGIIKETYSNRSFYINEPEY